MPSAAPAAAHPPFGVQLRGVVKAVPSGDTLVLLKPGGGSGGPPPELRVGLSSVRAPALGREGVADEAGAWAAREALRKRVIGKPVGFVLEYAVEALGGRLMAEVRAVEDRGGVVGPVDEPLGVEMARGGYVRVRRPNDVKEKRAEGYDALCKAEDEAVAAGVGVHGSGAVGREVVWGEVDAAKVVAACRGIELGGVVEYVSNGSAMKVFFPALPGGLGDRVLTVCLSGVQCPGFRRDGEGVARPAPFALNAKFLTETRLLHRDVKVRVEGADRNGMLFATVVGAEDGAKYVGEELLRAGYAKTVAWSIEFSARAPALRAAERTARDSQLGVWKGFVAKGVEEKVFVGRCVEVVSGDMVAVSTGGEVKRLYLASVRAARAEGGRDRSIVQLGPANDAKEALRKKLIGREVRVQIVYTREPAEGAVRKDVMSFAVIGREGDAKNTDVAVPMISDGLLSVVRHRGEEERSPNYELYLGREKLAQEAQAGVHRTVDGGHPVMRVNNLTGPEARKRSRDVAPGLMRGNPHMGVIEYVSSASRFRIFMPKDSMLITLGLKAVRTPQPSRKTYLPDGTARVESKEEPHGDEALTFAREAFMQRDVEVTINAVDRVGAFLGSAFVVNTKGERTDIAKALLDSGMGYLHESFDPREVGGGALKIAESAAREGKVGLWADYVEEEVGDTSAGNGATVSGDPSVVLKTIKGSVCEVGFGGRIFVQGKDSGALIKAVEAGLASLSLNTDAPVPLSNLRLGETVVAKYSADGLWYRAKVLSKSPEGALVRFVDYGNEETVPQAKIRRPAVPGAFMSKEPAATEVRLVDIVVPDAGHPYGNDAGALIRDLAYGKEVDVSVRSLDGPGRVVGDILVTPPSKDGATAAPAATNGGSSSSTAGSPAPKRSLVELLLESGIVRIERKSNRAAKATFARLTDFEKVGQATRDYLWTYGDAFDSDEDDDEETKERNQRRR